MRDDESLYAAAVKAYPRDCERLGIIPDSPSYSQSWVIRGDTGATVFLANARGEIARYGFTGKPLRMRWRHIG